jgi:hypothetical protein
MPSIWRKEPTELEKKVKKLEDAVFPKPTNYFSLLLAQDYCNSLFGGEEEKKHKNSIEKLEDRLNEQVRLNKLLLEYLGIEHFITTDTSDYKSDTKESYRKIKKSK